MKLHFSLSNGRSFTPFSFTIQPIRRCQFLFVAQMISKVVLLYQGAFVGAVKAPELVVTM